MIKKQFLIVGILGILLAVIVIIAGASLQPNTSNETPIDTKVSEPESLQAILSKADSIRSLSYEIQGTITMPQYPTTTLAIHVWQEKPYLKEDITTQTMGISTTLIVIVRPEGTYVYNPTLGKYVLTTDIPSYVTSLQYLDPKMIKDLLNNQTITDYDTEILDGKLATIVDYNIPVIGENSLAVKIWIWNEKGLPLKATMTMHMEQITMTMEFLFSQYSFTDIPDNTFNVT